MKTLGVEIRVAMLHTPQEELNVSVFPGQSIILFANKELVSRRQHGHISGNILRDDEIYFFFPARP